MPAAGHPTNRAASAYVPRAATRRRRPLQPSRSRTNLAALATRLTLRDRWLLEMLHEHRVLTSHHITQLAFTSHRSANRRLRALYFMGVVDSFRPLLQTGSAPEHYTLGRAGAEILAAARSTTLDALGWRKDLCARTAFSPTLAHDLAVNTHLVTLAATGRTHAEQQLQVWLSPRSAARLWGDWVHPDAYAHFRHGPTTVPFFLEYDTGTERPLARVEAKLAGYASLAATTGTRTPLLIYTSTPRRETALRTRIAETAGQMQLLLATANTELAAPGGPGDLAGPLWLPLGRAASGRLPLAALSPQWPGLIPALTSHDVEPAPGRPAEQAWRPIPPLPPQEPDR